MNIYDKSGIINMRKIYMRKKKSVTKKKKKSVTKNPNVPKKKVTHLDQLKFYIFFNKSVIIY